MIDLYKPYMPDDLSELNQILYSGALAYGKWGRKFEDSIQSFLNISNRVIVVNSYTAAIEVLLSTLGLTMDDEIIASPQSCLASTQPLSTFGVKVVWADIDPTRGTLCPSSVESKITPRTKVIFHNHHCSYPGYIDEINEIGRRYGIITVDDCIEAFGASYKGSVLGSLNTDITLFSFQTVRLPNTIDGGAIVFKDSALYCKAVRVRDLGVDRTTFRLSDGEINPKSDVDIHGYGVTMSEINSYIGYQQMKAVPLLLKKQRDNAAIWKKNILNNYSHISLLDTVCIDPSFWVFGILSKNKARDIEHFRNIGFKASGVHVPNTIYSIFGSNCDLPGVNEFHQKFIALPSGWWVNL